MLAFMGNCLSSWKKGNGKGCKKVTLAMLGLDNAGKTVTAKGLQGVPRDMVAPTVGFDSVDFRFLQYDVTMFDLGGGVRIRDIWKNYLAEIYGVVFVVDSSEPDRMEECRQTFTDLLQQPKVAGKPILLLANKQDKPGALDEIDICEYLNLEDVVNKTQCPCKLKTCAALPGEGKKMDPAIGSGLKWLLTMICKDYESLHRRVEEDMEEQRQREAEEKKARQERVRKIKEEREKEEAIQRANNGQGDQMDSDVDDENDMVMGDNPFKRLDLNELKEKEKKQKKEKKRQKEQEAEKVKEQVVVARGNMFDSPYHNGVTSGDDNVPWDQANRHTTLPASRSSPLHSLLPSESVDDRVSGDGDKCALPPVPKARNGEIYGSIFEPGNLQNGTDGLKFGATHVVASVSRLEPLESVSKKYKKKKKKKRNQTVPKDGDNDMTETEMRKEHHSSKVLSETTRDTEDSDFSKKWALVDELPSLDGGSYNRPNCEDDESIIT